MANTINLAAISAAMPKSFVGDLINATRANSVVASLSPAEPMNFGPSNILTVSSRPRAEFVGESQQKSGTDGSLDTRTIEPRKAQVTVRVTNEVEWANPQAAPPRATTAATSPVMSWLPRPRVTMVKVS